MPSSFYPHGERVSPLFNFFVLHPECTPLLNSPCRKMIPQHQMLCLLAISGWIVSCCPTSREKILEGRDISGISFRYTGPRTVKEEFLRRYIKSFPGTEYSSDKINADFMALYESGLVDDLKVDAQPSGGSVRLVFGVTTRRPFGPSGFVGNRAFSDQKLAMKTGLSYGSRPRKDDLQKAANAVEKFYQSNGYPGARVTVESFNGGSPTPDDFVFVINEGSGEAASRGPE